MKVYSPKDIADLLGVETSTLRKYSILLENAGMEFQRNNQNQRWYYDKDVIAFRKLVTLRDNSDMKLKECAEQVYLWNKGNDVTEALTVADNDTQRHDIDELKEMIQQQHKMIHKQGKMMQGLSDQLHQQQKHIDDSIKERDKLLTETAEKKKGLFARLFNK